MLTNRDGREEGERVGIHIIESKNPFEIMVLYDCDGNRFLSFSFSLLTISQQSYNTFLLPNKEEAIERAVEDQSTA